jgi:UDP-N-acetylglucosamine--N-acetylmuramyl-(pentapeptide) pyrophosphoryl-undecaprenol N-acetylglucosamine transferase
LYVGPCGLGLGHITRCDAIAREFSNEGVDVLFSSYLDALDYLKRSGFTYFSAIPLSFRTREDGTIDPKMTMSQNGVTVGLWGFIRQLIGEVRQISAFEPDVVISDTRISTLVAAFILRKPRILILNQYSVQMPKDDRKHRLADRPMLFAAKIIWRYISAMLELAWGVSDLIIVPDLKAPYTISRYNLAIPPGIRSKVRLVGPLTPARLKIPNGIRHSHMAWPLVFACVSGPATDRKYLVNKLTDILTEFPGDYELVLSCGDPNGSFGEKKIGNLTVHEWMTEQSYWKTFERADVIVSRAGHETIMKAISEGKPLVLIPPPNHTEQANNAKRAEELGVAVVLDQSRLDTQGLAKAISTSLRNNRENAQRLSESLGSESGIRAVVEAVSQLVAAK